MSTVINSEVLAFKDHMDHLTAEMEVIRRGLAKRTEEMSVRFAAEMENAFKGYGITPAEAMCHIKKADNASEDSCYIVDQDLIETVSIRAEKSITCGMALPLVRLSQLFGLSRFETDILLTCLLPEFYPGFSKVFGFLQDDATQLYPTMGFLLEHCCPDNSNRELAWRSFHPLGPLRSWNLIIPLGNEEQIPPLKRSYRVDERVVTYLMGGSIYDGRLDDIIHLSQARECRDDQEYAIALENIITDVIEGNQCQLVTLTGDKTKSDNFVHSIAGRLKWKIIKVFVSSLYQRNEWNIKLLNLLLREAVMQPAVIELNEEDVNADIADAAPLWNALARNGILVFYRGRRISSLGNISDRPLKHVKLTFLSPGASERFIHWKKAIAHHGLGWPDHAAQQLAMRYKLSQEQITPLLNRLRLDPGAGLQSPQKTLEQFHKIINEDIRHPLDELATRIDPTFEWDDLVLSKPVMEHLVAFRSRIAHQFKVYEQWGVGKKLPRGRGVTALFSGTSGTGKTMAAEIIARDLGINLYRIDLAGLVSKYIGETEKNIKKIFDNAQGNVLLFFDEADALFGRRTEIKDSHDRYANLEVNYLLQRLEEHEGPVILATNMRKNLDEAFLRRIHFIIEFPVPSEPLRKILFNKYILPTIPQEEDIDLFILAKHFEVTGGDIKNAVLQAAFAAAENGNKLTMEHLLMALKRECLKLGKHFPGDQVNHLCKNISNSPEKRRLRKGAATTWKSA
jgi:DNA polymerase III delta prime subunit